MPIHALVQSPKPPSKRVLVLGSDEHPQAVWAYRWTELPELLNVADFDVVIINTAAADETEDGIDWDGITPPSVAQFARLWFAERTEVIVISSLEPTSKISSFFWSPAAPYRETQVGEVVQDVHVDWAWYLDRLVVYSQFYTGGFRANWDARSYFENLGIDADDFSVALKPLAMTRHGRPIAVEMRLDGLVNTYGNDVKTVARSSQAFVLPTIYGTKSADVVNLVLQHRYGFEITTAAPEWSGAYVLPSHAPVLGELAALREAIADAERRLPDVQKREAHAGRFQALLYEGDDALEPLVREALLQLGGTVEEPAAKGVEDGRVTDPGGNQYMLEVKGVSGPLKIRDVRQLADWVNRGIEEGWDSRGLLVLNALRDKPPCERSELVPHNALKASARWDQTILTTTQLFQALADFESGQLDAGLFWRAIADAKGLVTGLSEIKAVSDERKSAATEPSST